MTADDHRFTFGPVPSRRLGRSLGINNIPAKACTYACVYCQVGGTTRMRNERRPFFVPEKIVQDVQRRLKRVAAAAERVDYLTFVPDGEPTQDIHLGKEIAALKGLGVPIGVITNSSLVWRDDVREELNEADWVSFKVDATQEEVWRQINRPHRSLRLDKILDGILSFKARFTGVLVTETMLVKGINDNEACMQDVADFLHQLRPEKAYLSVPTRPPAEDSVRMPDEKAVAQAYSLFSDKVAQVECLTGYEGDEFALTDGVAEDILSISAVHPLREEAVQTLLTRAGAPWTVVEQLIGRGLMVETQHGGHRFFVRKFNG